jgi:ABC-type cobalamin transport system permease subunit
MTKKFETFMGLITGYNIIAYLFLLTTYVLFGLHTYHYKNENFILYGVLIGIISIGVLISIFYFTSHNLNK